MKRNRAGAAVMESNAISYMSRLTIYPTANENVEIINRNRKIVPSFAVFTV